MLAKCRLANTVFVSVQRALADCGVIGFTNTWEKMNGNTVASDLQPNHNGDWMYHNGNYCAYPTAWNNEAFTVVWENPCY